MLEQRLLTAVILIPLMVWGVLDLTAEWLAILLIPFVLFGAWEWAAICGWHSQSQRLAYTASVMLCLGLTWLLWQVESRSIIVLLVITCLWWLLALVWVWRYQQGIDQLPDHPSSKAVLGLLILLPAWMSLFILHHHYGGQQVLFLMVMIWVADSGAYFAGHLWGCNKLADRISPGKTWEGVMAALFCSFLLAAGYTGLISMKITIIPLFLLLCLLTVMGSILGDLLESLFKRQMGLKDSSQLLPGHGGVLDRIDSLTAAAPIFAAGMLMLGNGS